MKKQAFIVSLVALALAACGQNSKESPNEDAAYAAEAAKPMSADTSEPASQIDFPAIPANMPKIAYDFGLSFALPAKDIGPLMRRHATLCEQQGPMSCRIVGMNLAGSAERDDVSGTLQIAVAANHARAVSALLENEAAEVGAEQTAATIGSEEVSKSIVDTEARIRAREELRDRLTEVLRTRKGKVSELIEAERQVAAVNEEIDQAKSWLAETKGRVAFSQMTVDYATQSAVTSDIFGPAAAVFGKLGSIFGYVLAAMLLVGAIVAPIAGVIWAGRVFNRSLTAIPAKEG